MPTEAGTQADLEFFSMMLSVVGASNPMQYELDHVDGPRSKRTTAMRSTGSVTSGCDGSRESTQGDGGWEVLLGLNKAPKSVLII